MSRRLWGYCRRGALPSHGGHRSQLTSDSPEYCAADGALRPTSTASDVQNTGQRAHGVGTERPDDGVPSCCCQRPRDHVPQTAGSYLFPLSRYHLSTVPAAGTNHLRPHCGRDARRGTPHPWERGGARSCVSCVCGGTFSNGPPPLQAAPAYLSRPRTDFPRHRKATALPVVVNCGTVPVRPARALHQ